MSSGLSAVKDGRTRICGWRWTDTFSGCRTRTTAPITGLGRWTSSTYVDTCDQVLALLTEKYSNGARAAVINDGTLAFFAPRPCLKNVNMPEQRVFFRDTALIFLAIHKVLLRQIALSGEKILRCWVYFQFSNKA